MNRKMLFRLLSFLTAGIFLASSCVAWTASSKFSPAGSFSGAYLAGLVATEENNIDVATDYFRQALSYEPENTLVKQKLLFTSLLSGKFKEAVNLATTSLHNDNDIKRVARLLLSADAFNRQRFREAKSNIQHLDFGLIDRLTSTLLSAWADYGIGNFQSACRQLEQLEGPSWYELFRNYHLALMHALNGQKQAAEQSFQQSIKDQEGSIAIPDIYERVIIAYTSFKLLNNERQEAIKVLKHAETILLGRNTLRIFREQIEKCKNPGHFISKAAAGAAEAIYNIGTIINYAGGGVYACIYLNIALAMRPGNDAILLQLADLAIKSHQLDQAIIFYQDVAKQSPYFHDASLRLSLNLADIGEFDKAISNLNYLTALYPEDTQFLLALSSIYMHNFRYTEAAKVFDHIMEQPNINQKDRWSLFYQRGIVYEQLKEWNKAEIEFRKALKLYPEHPEVLNYLGYSLIDRNIKLDEALAMVCKAAELRPQDGYIIDSLGWAYYKLGHYRNAVSELEKAIKLRPEDSTINDHLGNAYWKVGRRREATFQWNHALADNSDPVKRIHIQEKLLHGLKERVTVTGKGD
ncbi:MAG: Tetratricopeptide repeat protein [Candidatus Tokpelaia sp. JSC188]|nr:MAG: Tetratricopeptide repeat protein [Candidatus Tokpelaia sp. JSC188]